MRRYQSTSFPRTLFHKLSIERDLEINMDIIYIFYYAECKFYNNPRPLARVIGIPTPGPRLIPTPSAPLFFTSSTRARAIEIAATIHAPQRHFIPCHAYLPTFVLHLGHSSLPSN